MIDDEAAWVARECAVLRHERQALDIAMDRARRDSDAALAALTRLQTRRATRIAVRVDDGIDRAVRAVRTVRRVASRATGSGRARPQPGHGHARPAAFRASFLNALDTRRLRFAVVPPDVPPADPAMDSSRVIAAALAAAGWPMTDDRASADVVIVTDPTQDGQHLARGPVLVAALGEVPSSGLPLSRDVDVVVVPNERVAASLVPSMPPPVILSDPTGHTARGNGADWSDVPVEALISALRQWAAGIRFGISIGVPSWAEAPTWGDLHFARDLQRQLVRRGFATRLHLLPDWQDAVAARDDVAIHLFGLRERVALPGQHTILWVISHPERLTPSMVSSADRTYIASDLVAERVRHETERPVSALHQATDPDRFRVDRTGPRHAVLFVGNTRGVRRTVVEQLVPTTIDLSVYGLGWSSQYPSAPFVRGEHVPNDDLHRWYGSADIVLSDHWADMRSAGLFSNRLYDALASGAFVISDDVPGMAEEFDGGVVTASSPGALRFAIRDHLADPVRRRVAADRGRAAVLARHTFAHRADTILADAAVDLGGSLAPSGPMAG